MPANPHSKKTKSLQLLAIPAALLFSFVIYLLREQVLVLRQYGYLGIFLLSVIGNATVILPMPTFVAAFVGGGVLHPPFVGLLAGAGAAVGELTGYLAGLGGQAIVKDWKAYKRIKKWVRRYGFFGILLLASFPNVLFDMAGIAAGVMRLPIPLFLLATFLGKTIMFLSISYLGRGSAGIFDHFFTP